MEDGARSVDDPPKSRAKELLQEEADPLRKFFDSLGKASLQRSLRLPFGFRRLCSPALSLPKTLFLLRLLDLGSELLPELIRLLLHRLCDAASPVERDQTLDLLSSQEEIHLRDPAKQQILIHPSLRLPYGFTVMNFSSSGSTLPMTSAFVSSPAARRASIALSFSSAGIA